MRVGAALSETTDGGLAAVEAADAAAQPLDGAPVRLAVVFASAHHSGALDAIGAAVEARLQPDVMIGAVAEGIVGPWREVEDAPAVAVWCASFDGGEVRPFRTWAQRAVEGGIAVVGWPETEPGDVALVLADPRTYPIGEVVRHVGERQPGSRVVGGLVGPVQDAARLVMRAPAESTATEVHDDGAVGVVLRGVDVTAIVSQGCRPVGGPLVVTKVSGHHIEEIAGAPAIQRIREIYEDASPRDRELMSAGLQIGLVADEYRDEFTTGDFLVRAVIGADEESGAIAVGDVARVGQTVQFQVRDAESADADLRQTLAGYGGSAAGALLFTCNGRGYRFFGAPDHDVRLVGEEMTERVAGAFCAGEIGPVGDTSHLHGYTASLAVFGAG